MKSISIRQRAKEAGSLLFDPGEPCRRGHIALRYVSSRMCVDCSRENDKRNRKRDPEERKRANRKYYSKPGSMDAQVQRSKKWKEKNPEKVRIMYRRGHHKRRVRIASSEDHFALHQILELGAKQRWRCANQACGVRIKSRYQIDHIMPLARGGSNGIKNIQLLCVPCTD